MSMALNIFVSYKREDLEMAKKLERTLHANGLRAWRDLVFLPFGHDTETEVRSAINEEVGGFSLIVTENSLSSDFIWRIELPAALERARTGGGAFPIIPIFVGDSLVPKFARKSVSELGHDLSIQNGIVLHNEDDAEGLNRLAGRLLESLIGDQPYTRISLFTHSEIPTLDPHDIVVDIRESFSQNIPTSEEWERLILPGMRNIKAALLHKKRPQRSVWLPSRIHLSAALAYGWVFRDVTGFTLDPSDSLIGENPETLLDPSDLPPMTVDVRRGSSSSDRLAVAVSLAKDVRPTIQSMLRESTYEYSACAQLSAASPGGNGLFMIEGVERSAAVGL
ncbi:TIR domain-containing protein [Mycobacteroides abscessus]|uniref:TIR domain-containing protein n=1 Tax=Mycobacteroides abscessus TaxID=36809 RepID=UPI0021020E1E|nr:TIR domain-containing protein [Mycobacteroides abscessus]